MMARPKYVVAVICSVKKDTITDLQGFLHHRIHTRGEKTGSASLSGPDRSLGPPPGGFAFLTTCLSVTLIKQGLRTGFPSPSNWDT